MRAFCAAVLVLMACSGEMSGPDSGEPDAGTPDGGVADAGLRPRVFLPDCGTPDPDGGFAQDIFDNVVTPGSCTAGGCHGAGGYHYIFSDAASMKAAWTNQVANEAPMNAVTPFDVDESYVMYKVCGQQADAGGSGLRMPQGLAPLKPEQVCALANWIRAGAR
jgi:hypothetical protein